MVCILLLAMPNVSNGEEGRKAGKASEASHGVIFRRKTYITMPQAGLVQVDCNT